MTGTGAVQGNYNQASATGANKSDSQGQHYQSHATGSTNVQAELKAYDRERGGDDSQFKNSLRENLDRNAHATEFKTQANTGYSASINNQGISHDKDSTALERNQKANESAQKAGHINPGEGFNQTSNQLGEHTKL